MEAQVVHSLAKWKRMALYRYDFHTGKGIYADMNAIRRDEELDNLHSIYVDQWDWERVITREMRTLRFLQDTVRDIVRCISDTSLLVNGRYPRLRTQLSDEVTFLSAQELLDLYPDLPAKERENAFVREHPVTFLMGIGHKLSNGQPHDGRAPTMTTGTSTVICSTTARCWTRPLSSVPWVSASTANRWTAS